MQALRYAVERIAASLLGAVCVCSCALDAPESVNPAVPLRFEQQSIAAAARWPDADFFHRFGSDQLDALVALGETGSLDIAAAAARVRQADARARIAGAALLPKVDATGAATLFTGGTGGTNAHETDWSALLSASYEVDFWGKNRAAGESAKSLAQAGRAELATVRTTVLSGIASTYFHVLSLRQRTELARSNLAAAKKLLQFIEARFAAGRGAPSDLAVQRAAVANAELTIPQLQHQELEATGALAVLVGRSPEGFGVRAERLESMLEPGIAAGLPSELLQRRPDLMAAESNLSAADADLRAARAAMFPSLDLTVAGGAQNPAVQAAVITLSGTGYALNAGAAAAQAVFDGGRRRAVIAAIRQRRAELLLNYRNAILAALLDVENALGQLRHLDEQQKAQTESLAQSERAFDGTQLRYREGSAPILAVLEAQRTLYAAREQASQYKLNRLLALLSLSKALGGGWQFSAADTAKRQ
jgi:outer membrane protein, multidrug efflux system